MQTHQPPKDQYQHYIPRFIIRNFQDAQNQPKSRKDRLKMFRKAKKTGVDTDTVAVFDIHSQTFSEQPIAKVFGIVNLYRDGTNETNVDHLEEALAKLENHAARVIKELVDASKSGLDTFQTTRKDLEALRKFIYIQHYRRTSLLPSYYDSEDPDNASIREFMINFRKKHNLQSDREYWLFGLKYILDTPHHKLVREYELMQEKYGGPMKFLMMKNTSIDPDLDNYYTVDYGCIAELYMGIWQAHPDEEFIIADNSFGFFEGSLLVEGQLLTNCHRLFVISPRLALILTSPYVRQFPEGVLTVKSIFKFITPPATPTYHDLKLDHAWSDEKIQTALVEYRATASAQQDTFAFQFVHLNKTQTLSMNKIMFYHVQNQLTFSSYPAMRRSIEAYLDTKDAEYARENKHFVRTLLGVLASGSAVPTDTTTPSPGRGVDVVLQSILNGAVEFKSTYDRAYRVFHLVTDNHQSYGSVSAEIHKMTALACLKMKAMFPPPDISERHAFFDKKIPIVSTLPKNESELFFALIGLQVDVLKVGPLDDTLLGRIKYEAAIIGFTEWLAENHPVELLKRVHRWASISPRLQASIQEDAETMLYTPWKSSGPVPEEWSQPAAKKKEPPPKKRTVWGAR